MDEQTKTLHEVKTLMKEGNYPDAISKLEEKLEKEPHHTIYLGKISECYRETGDFHNAHHYLDKTRGPIESNYRNFKKEVEAGSLDIKSQEYKVVRNDMVLFLEKKAAIYLRESNSEKEDGKLDSAGKKLDKAEETINKALEIVPVHHGALMRKISILREKADFKEANKTAEFLIERTKIFIGNTKNNNDYQVALKIKEDLINFERKFGNSKAIIPLSEKNNTGGTEISNPTEKPRRRRILISKPSEDYETRILKHIKELVNKNDYPGAIIILEKELEKDPKHGIYLGQISDCYKEIGDYHKAHHYIDKRRDPAEVLYKDLSRGLIADRFDPRYEEYMKAKNDLLIIYTMKASIYCEESKSKSKEDKLQDAEYKLTEAEKFADKALEIHPTSYPALRSKISVLRLKKDFIGAHRTTDVLIKRALKHMERDPVKATNEYCIALQIKADLHHLSANIHKSNGKKVSARDSFIAAINCIEKAISINPDDIYLLTNAKNICSDAENKEKEDYFTKKLADLTGKETSKKEKY